LNPASKVTIRVSSVHTLTSMAMADLPPAQAHTAPAIDLRLMSAMVGLPGLNL